MMAHDYRGLPWTMYYLARLIDRVTRARDHIWVWHPAPCMRCARPTWWVEVNFEAPLHRGKCTEVMDEEYFAALARPPRWCEGWGGACPDCGALERMPCLPGCQYCF